MGMTLQVVLALAMVVGLLAAPAQAHAQQVKFASIWEVPADNAALDEWYRRTHSREAKQSVGHLLVRYVAYRGYDVPAEAEKFNFIRYRLTEMWYGSAADRAEANKSWQPLSPPPVDRVNYPNKNQITQIWVPTVPDEQWVPAYPRAQATYLRWVFFMRYPAGVSQADGEAWFTKVHAPEMAKGPGVRRFVCHKSVDAPRDAKSYVRMCEVWFDDYAAWKNFALTNPPKYTAPAWAKGGADLEYASIFTAQNPDMDFLNDGYRLP
jgi:hypothetical protein